MSAKRPSSDISNGYSNGSHHEYGNMNESTNGNMNGNGDYDGQNKFILRGLKTTFGTSRTNDDVHGSIKLCPLMRCIIDTPQMQRLRGLKQLGVSEMTYVPTTHCRFEHSLGVASLSMEVLCEIAKKQPLLNITEKDIVCVKIAGLLHDIGHGPFSHVYDGQFRKQLRRAEREGVWLGQKFDRSLYDDDDVQEGKGGKRGYKDVNNHNGNDNDNDSFEGWEHEDGSLMMIDALLKYLGLEIDSDTRHLDLPLRQIGDGIDANCFGIYDFALGESYHQSRYGNGGTQTQPCYDGKTPLPNDLVLTSRDWIFIKECILGGPLPPKGMTIHKAKKLKRFQPLIGRPDRLKEFLYDVVSNRHSGLDVDKVDYLARDERRAFGTAGQIDSLFIENAYVAWGKCPSHDYLNQKLNLSMDSDKAGYHLMIVYPEKMVQSAMNFFKNRFRNHQKLYTHSNTVAACYMVTDILLLADPFVKIPTTCEGDGTSASTGRKKDHEPGRKLSISQANSHPESYLRLKDSILDIIAASDKPELAPARILLNRFRAHKIYKKVAEEAIVSSDGKNIDIPWQRKLWEMDELDIASQIVQCGQLLKDSTIKLKEDDIIIEKRKIHHGKGAQNPVSYMRFLPKSQLSKLRELPNQLPIAREIDEKEYECCMPRAFLQQTLRIFCREYSADTCDFLTTCYHQFIENVKKRSANNLYDNVDMNAQAQVSNDMYPNVLSQSPLRPTNDSFAASYSNLSSERGEPEPKRPRGRLFSRLSHIDSP